MRQLTVIGKIAHRPKKCGIFGAYFGNWAVTTVNIRATVAFAAPIPGWIRNGGAEQTRDPRSSYCLCNDNLTGGIRIE